MLQNTYIKLLYKFELRTNHIAQTDIAVLVYLLYDVDNISLANTGSGWIGLLTEPSSSVSPVVSSTRRVTTTTTYVESRRIWASFVSNRDYDDTVGQNVTSWTQAARSAIAATARVREDRVTELLLSPGKSCSVQFQP